MGARSPDMIEANHDVLFRYRIHRMSCRGLPHHSLCASSFLGLPSSELYTPEIRGSVPHASHEGRLAPAAAAKAVAERAHDLVVEDSLLASKDRNRVHLRLRRAHSKLQICIATTWKLHKPLSFLEGRPPH